MIVNRKTLLNKAPIVDMLKTKEHNGDTSYGLGELGYDIRIKQTVLFHPRGYPRWSEGPCVATKTFDHCGTQVGTFQHGRFVLASAMEEFNMPKDLGGIVHDKSTWARRGLSVFNTVIEPGWKGFLTLELVYHGDSELVIPAGSGIAQVIFHRTTDDAQYEGKYNNQEDMPVEARKS